MERFAGFTPGLMLVLGADIPAQSLSDELDGNDEEAVEDLEKVTFDSFDEALQWLKEKRITLKKTLGSGCFGTAFQVDHPKYGGDIALKVSMMDEERECVEYIQREELWENTPALPEIFEMGTFSDSLYFWYLRPMYDMSGYFSEDDEDRLKGDLMRGTDGEFWGWDIKPGNAGQDERGNWVYFDPACTLGFLASRQYIEWVLGKIKRWGIEKFLEISGLTLGDLQVFVDVYESQGQGTSRFQEELEKLQVVINQAQEAGL